MYQPAKSGGAGTHGRLSKRNGSHTMSAEGAEWQSLYSLLYLRTATHLLVLGKSFHHITLLRHTLNIPGYQLRVAYAPFAYALYALFLTASEI